MASDSKDFLDGYPPVSIDFLAAGGLRGVAGDGYIPVSMDFLASGGLGWMAGDGYPPVHGFPCFWRLGVAKCYFILYI